MNRKTLLKRIKSRYTLVATVGGRSCVKTALKAKRDGADLLELRLDDMLRFFPASRLAGMVKRARSAAALPVIATVRSPEEGGVYKNLSDKRRIEIYRAVINHADAVDVELNSAISAQVGPLARKNNRLLIMSWHNFKSTPGRNRLSAVARKARLAGADIVKIAVMSRSMEDVRRLLLFSKSWKQCPITVISMGKPGSISRIAGFRFNSCLTYGYVDGTFGPGQLSVKELSVCSGIEL